MATEGAYFYITGGRCRGKTLSTCERYSFERKVWEKTISLIENRGSHGSAALDGKLYVMGGGGFKSNLATCEVLDTKTGEWNLIAPMQSFRHDLSIARIGTDIYAVAGWIDGSKCVKYLEKYDTKTDKWSW